MIITRKGQDWLIKKIYPNFYLCVNKIGIRECFSKFEVDGVPDFLGKGKQYVFYIEDKPYTIKQLMLIYKMSRSQIDYRIRNNKELPDGRVIQRINMLEMLTDATD